jgi:hypothetical protein
MSRRDSSYLATTSLRVTYLTGAAAAGIEPYCSDNLNLLMAYGFGVYRFRNLELPRRFDSPGVPSSPLESPPVLEIYWRREEALFYDTALFDTPDIEAVQEPLSKSYFGMWIDLMGSSLHSSCFLS